MNRENLTNSHHSRTLVAMDDCSDNFGTVIGVAGDIDELVELELVGAAATSTRFFVAGPAVRSEGERQRILEHGREIMDPYAWLAQ